MGKALFIAEKPSVAQEFAKVLGISASPRDGFLEGGNVVITWCVGHLVTMSYPESYDIKYKKWNMNDLPFLPKEWKYEIIPSAKKQYAVVKKLLNREDIDTIYVCTDSGREGEYIYRLVAQEAGIGNKKQKRVWIDSQTEEEIQRGIKEAKDLSEYDNLSKSAYLRAKEDYLIGINFSRLLSLKYGYSVNNYLKGKWKSVSVGRVMTCVLGMICNREREIRNFVKTPFYRVVSDIGIEGGSIEAEWKALKGSNFYESPLLYKDNGFKEITSAQALIEGITKEEPVTMTVKSCSVKEEKKMPPMLYNLAELQNDCSKMFKISPDQTLNVVQKLYESKLVTYPRTDARVLSSAVAKEIGKNISGLTKYGPLAGFAANILNAGAHKGIANTKYTDDRKITDHYAIIPTGQGLSSLSKQSELAQKVYMVIARRFLSIFYPPAIYKKVSLSFTCTGHFDKETVETFNSNFKHLVSKGYLEVLEVPKQDKKEDKEGEDKEENIDDDIFNILSNLKKNDKIDALGFRIKEGETSPPKRYTSGSLILAMENAGQLIEDEELRAQIKGSGIGTSATRAEIIKKLVNIDYIDINKKTQVVTPTQLGEMVFGIVYISIRSLLNPELTASWEKGLSMVAEGKLSESEYMGKLEKYVNDRVNALRNVHNESQLQNYYNYVAGFYKNKAKKGNYKKKTNNTKAGS